MFWNESIMLYLIYQVWLCIITMDSLLHDAAYQDTCGDKLFTSMP
jgi:hypothetical protein